MLSDYYQIKNQRTEGDRTVFEIALNPDCRVYRGHFPDMPVAPGVCNIQMVRECVERIAGRPLQLSHITQCKMTTMLTPEQHPDLQIYIHKFEADEPPFPVHATIGRDDEVYFILKAEYSIPDPL
ncbi:MAG: hydroxymyristoyl-ACP dehydratase [Tannerella sp.]|jgi:3-hydroxyacyl-[acyl-carrier-protein] dehydratase|nr:hydroxymyristoyl-ACP dehydratase [Tannerella sp.]